MSLAGEVSVPEPASLAGEFSSRTVGDFRTVRVTCSTFRIARDLKRAALIPREHVIVNLVEAGTWRGRLAGRTIALNAGDLLLSQATNRLDLVMADSVWIGLLIPRVVFERHMRWQARFDGTSFSAGTVHAAMLGAMVRALCALPDRLPPREVERATAATLALLLSCLGGSAPVIQRVDDGRELLAKDIRRFIVRRLSDPSLGIALLCATFGISRSALYRAMGENGDVATIIRSLRLHAAARDLADPGRAATPLAAIARRNGFADERTFRRAFAREFGFPPSDLREGAAGMAIPGPVGADLQRWFLGL